MKVKRFLKGLDRRYANLAMMSDQSFDVVVDRARQIEISYAVDDSGRAKKNRAEGSSGVLHMGAPDSGGQSHFARECPFSEPQMGSQGSVTNVPRQLYPGASSIAGSQFSGQQG
ncbi:hypothetical protein GH714_005091 [Hevea brasiliensis]|uniref:Uncharacterized protein n=1 Tax=Hevea brasiliensis TaxID=3981 RepID=A0A6A6MBB0_HEVBR|nr:hypothetical protein GH714_005091 [Hevea brasiliensis]